MSVSVITEQIRLRKKPRHAKYTLLSEAIESEKLRLSSTISALFPRWFDGCWRSSKAWQKVAVDLTRKINLRTHNKLIKSSALIQKGFFAQPANRTPQNARLIVLVCLFYFVVERWVELLFNHPNQNAIQKTMLNSQLSYPFLVIVLYPLSVIFRRFFFCFHTCLVFFARSLTMALGWSTANRVWPSRPTTSFLPLALQSTTALVRNNYVCFVRFLFLKQSKGKKQAKQEKRQY